MLTLARRPNIRARLRPATALIRPASRLVLRPGLLLQKLGRPESQRLLVVAATLRPPRRL